MPRDGAKPLDLETASPGSPIVLEPAAVIAIRDRAAEPTEARQRRWAVAALILAGSIIVLGLWWARRPVEVSVTNPVLTPVMETIASRGLVGGVKESVIGASFNGAVLSLAVRLGDHVESGQVLAVLKNDITKAQVVQAESAVLTAEAS